MKPETLRDAFRRGRRLEPRAMQRLRASLEVNEDGVVSIAEDAQLPVEARRATRIARQLRTLHDALAKGKDFDLNGARARVEERAAWPGPAHGAEIGG